MTNSITPHPYLNLSSRPLALGLFLISTAALLLTTSPSARGAQGAQATDSEPSPSSTPSAPQSLENVGSEAERVSIENIKQKYWARGDENELGVVQNRLFTKEHKIELGLYTGVVASDPFLTVYSLGATIGFHFNEFLSINVFGMKDFVSPSSALTFLRSPYPNGAGSDTSTNQPNWFVGSELMASALYGKLSVLGKAIIHYDFHFILGTGLTSTESGTYFTPEIGVGQQFFITKWLTLRLDYRLMRYTETILQKVGSPTSPTGTNLGSRDNYTNAITLGLSFLVDPFHKKAPAEITK